ncbi:MAG TPA: alpha/beta fold hydrolase, partial [Solirubrobacteraceae bacterium]|nr:alpha/beta fold hydrolase [Solirubrobacteraceae bacterium]
MTARKRVVLAAVTALAAAVPTGTAEAEIAFAPCEELECGTVTVPLDHTGAVPGTLDLAVYRARARGQSRGVLLGFPGGPGDDGRSYLRRRLAAFGAARATHDVVFVDPRGTGRSAPLGCDDAPSCARELGAASSLYTARDVADDAEAVRAALGVERMALYAISHGGWYAQTYARRFPDRVSVLALDAPGTDALMEDPFERAVFAAVPGVLRALCDPLACGPGRDPFADAVAAIRDLKGELLGRLVAAALGADLNPAARAELPAALAA